MTDQPRDTASPHASSTGHAYTGAAWLDARFEAWRPEWEAMVRSVGIEPGWRVLDAGCGNGSFLPLLAALVGQDGQLAAFDLAPDLLATLEQRLPGWGLPYPVTTRAGSLTALPYPDNAFDVVWCANALMYLTEPEATTALAEFHRVVRPGGLVAIKETDSGLYQAYPLDPTVYTRFIDASSRVEGQWGVQIRGSLRARSYRRRLEQAGLVAVRQQTILCERWAPLSPAEQQTIGALTSGFARFALEHLALPDSDLAAWRTMRDPDSPDHPLRRPDFYFCKSDTLVVGRIP